MTSGDLLCVTHKRLEMFLRSVYFMTKKGASLEGFGGADVDVVAVVHTGCNSEWIYRR